MSEPHKPNSATFIRLRDGSWGLRVVGDTSPGSVVSVLRKDNSVHQITVGRVVGKSGDVWFCTIATEEEKAKFAARPNRSFNEEKHTTKPIKEIYSDDDSIPFDPPYKIIEGKS